ncbi:MAG: tRNA uridine-5-carboxymethylaminomethyl(34) synthesis GTPase MnmE [Lentisphaeria bacterium]|nr:tRNA uridine-5-carboxymethylaminomethyl(34) synthesis GTPase MnmE [Lentisphaeria bacterium]
MATAVGGAVSIIRISGEKALEAGNSLWHGSKTLSSKDARRMLLGEVRDAFGTTIDASCLAVYMPGPHSYTGEDVVELQLHGGPIAAKLALEALMALGIRGAEAGEFTRRAFLNGRMDLTQAEAVCDIVAAETQQALSLANRQLAGALGTEIRRHYDELSFLLSEIESHLDFPEEELDWLPTEEVSGRINAVHEAMLSLAETSREGEILRNGVTLAIAGAPNVGKSSLLNRLLGRDRAIVSPIPGTTRDTVEADFVLRGIPIHLVDTAGARDASDTIEQSGIERAKSAVADADVVLWLTDASRKDALKWPEWPHRGALVQASNKCDIAAPHDGTIGLSAVTGEGIECLLDALEAAILGRSGGITQGLAVSSRHATLLRSAAKALTGVEVLLTESAWELAAIPIRQAITALGSITGQSVSPDVLDSIFHRFCIGK